MIRRIDDVSKYERLIINIDDRIHRNIGGLNDNGAPEHAVIHVTHTSTDQAAFFASPRYVSMTRGSAASSSAGPAIAISPVSIT